MKIYSDFRLFMVQVLGSKKERVQSQDSKWYSWKQVNSRSLRNGWKRVGRDFEIVLLLSRTITLPSQCLLQFLWWVCIYTSFCMRVFLNKSLRYGSRKAVGQEGPDLQYHCSKGPSLVGLYKKLNSDQISDSSRCNSYMSWAEGNAQDDTRSHGRHSVRFSTPYTRLCFWHQDRLTNDGNAILREIDVAHPAAKNMIELSRTQDEECGDGTTSVIILGMWSSLVTDIFYSKSLQLAKFLCNLFLNWSVTFILSSSSAPTRRPSPRPCALWMLYLFPLIPARTSRCCP